MNTPALATAIASASHAKHLTALADQIKLMLGKQMLSTHDCLSSQLTIRFASLLISACTTSLAPRPMASPIEKDLPTCTFRMACC